MRQDEPRIAKCIATSIAKHCRVRVEWYTHGRGILAACVSGSVAREGPGQAQGPAVASRFDVAVQGLKAAAYFRTSGLDEGGEFRVLATVVGHHRRRACLACREANTHRAGGSQIAKRFSLLFASPICTRNCE